MLRFIAQPFNLLNIDDVRGLGYALQVAVDTDDLHSSVHRIAPRLVHGEIADRYGQHFRHNDMIA